MADIDEWSMTIFNDCDELDYCEACVSTDGRVGRSTRVIDTELTR